MRYRESSSEKTAVGVLGTLGAWHRWSPAYGLRHLEAVVRGFAPDLLCAEINRVDWEAGRCASFPIEYRRCLIRLCRELGVVIVPVGDRWDRPLSPLRLALMVGVGIRWANSEAGDRWHRAWACLWPDAGQADHESVAQILEAARRDPGRRMLVTVQLERRYAVVEGLCRADEVTLVSIWSSPNI